MSNAKLMAAAVFGLAAIQVIAIACSSGTPTASRDLPVWCLGLVDSFPFERDDLGQCYALSGVVVGVDTSSGDGTLAYVAVDEGESRPAQVSMSSECSTWEVGDTFDEEVTIVARISWPVDFNLPYCVAKPVPSRASIPEDVSYDWCSEGEPLPIPAIRDLVIEPEAQFPEPSERYLNKCL